MRSQARRNIFLIGLRQLLLIAFSILALYPIYYMVVTAFKTREDWLHEPVRVPQPDHLPELYGCPEPRQYPALVREQRRRDDLPALPSPHLSRSWRPIRLPVSDLAGGCCTSIP